MGVGVEQRRSAKALRRSEAGADFLSDASERDPNGSAETDQRFGTGQAVPLARPASPRGHIDGGGTLVRVAMHTNSPFMVP